MLPLQLKSFYIFLFQLTVQDFALQWQKSNSFIHYLKQNLLQFLNVPKYTDSRQEAHFKDYTVGSESNVLPFENIFIYNQSQQSGSTGIACIVLALYCNLNDISMVESENHFETVFITKDYENCVNSRRIEDREDLPDSYLEFRLWKQGRINIDNLSKKLTAAVSQATWDIVTEYYLLKKPLCVDDYRENVYVTKKKIEINALNMDLDKEIEYSCELDLTFDKNLRSKVREGLPKKLDAHLFPNRKYSKRSTAHPVSLKASRVITYDIEKETTDTTNDDGVLSLVYSKFLPSWMEFGDQIQAPAVKKHVINLPNRHLPSTIVKELITMLVDSPKAFRALSTHSLNSKSEDVFVPFIESSVIARYVIISRSFQKWQNTENCSSDILETLNPQNLKHTQKFVPVVLDNVLIPRQKMFWISVENDNVSIFFYL